MTVVVARFTVGRRSRSAVRFKKAIDVPTVKDSGDGKLSAYPLIQLQTRIGRHPANDIDLLGLGVSGSHALLIQDGS